MFDDNQFAFEQDMVNASPLSGDAVEADAWGGHNIQQRLPDNGAGLIDTVIDRFHKVAEHLPYLVRFDVFLYGHHLIDVIQFLTIVAQALKFDAVGMEQEEQEDRLGQVGHFHLLWRIVRKEDARLTVYDDAAQGIVVETAEPGCSPNMEWNSFRTSSSPEKSLFLIRSINKRFAV